MIAITQFRNAVSLQADNLRMDVEINHPDFGWIPYTLDPADTDATIDNDAVMSLIGDDFTAYVPPTQAELDAKLSEQLRMDRDDLLVELDFFVGNPLRWATLSTEQQNAWAVYRQALLDVPQQAGFPNDVTWPTKP